MMSASDDSQRREDQAFHNGHQLYEAKQFQDAAAIFQRTAIAYKHLRVPTSQADSFYWLGRCQDALQQYDQSIAAYQEALALYREIDEPQQAVNTLHQLGLAYAALRRYPQALDSYQQSFTLAQAIRDSIPQPSAVNIVSASIRLYFVNFLPNLGLSVAFTLWLQSCFLLLAFAFYVDQFLQHKAISILLVPVWIVSMLYCMSKSMANSATIARLAFNMLTHQTETVKKARQFTNARKWGFLKINLPLRFMLIAIGAGISALAELAFNNSTSIELSSISLTAIIILVPLLAWLLCRLFILDLPLVTERGIGVMRSIGQGWSLTYGSVQKIFLTFSLAFLVALPPAMLTQAMLTQRFSLYFEGIIMARTSSEIPVHYVILIIIARSFPWVAVNIFFTPLWESSRAIIYYSLRSCRESLEL